MYPPKDVRDLNRVGKGLRRRNTEVAAAQVSPEGCSPALMDSTGHLSFISMISEITGLLQDQIGLPGGTWGSSGPGWQLYSVMSAAFLRDRYLL